MTIPVHYLIYMFLNACDTYDKLIWEEDYNQHLGNKHTHINIR